MSTAQQEDTPNTQGHALQETAPLLEYGDFLDEPDDGGGAAGLSVTPETPAPSSGEVALWRAVIEQAMDDACILRPNPGVNRFPTPASRERDRVRATASDWFKSGGQDFSLVCDWADLPAEAVQGHAFERLGTPAEQRSRLVRQVVWRAPVNVTAPETG